MFLGLKIIILLRPFFSYAISFWSSLFFSLLLLIFLSLYILKNKLTLNKIKYLWPAIFLFILSIGLSVIFSQNFILSMGFLHNYVLYIMIFFVAISFPEIQKKQIIDTFLICLFILSSLTMVHYFFRLGSFFKIVKKYDVIYDFGVVYVDNKRTFFPLANPNALAGILAIFTPFILERKKLYPLLIWVSFAIFLTKSIGAFISLYIGLVIYYLLTKEKREKKNSLNIIFLSLIGIMIFIIFLIRHNNSSDLNLFLSIKRRVQYWKETIELIKIHPFLGWGLSNSMLTSTRYSHNILLQLWTEIGILGTVSFVYFLILIFKSLILNIKNNKNKILSIQLLVANIIFLSHNFVDFTFFTPEVSFFWWIIIGMSV